MKRKKKKRWCLGNDGLFMNKQAIFGNVDICVASVSIFTRHVIILKVIECYEIVNIGMEVLKRACDGNLVHN